MKKSKEQKCIFCNSKFIDKNSLYSHVQENHSALIPNDMSVSQYIFNLKYKKEFGTCVICKNKTKWNESTERYDRLCSERCKEEYKKAFQKRMIDKHGKIYLTRDPEHQRKMLANRKISGKYKWSDGVSEVGYTGSYEHEFLKFLDIVMNFNATDVISPAPQNFYYKDENGKDHFYFPDFYIPSLNLIIEIKDGGNNPNKHHKIQEVDKKLEKFKDDIMRNQKQYNYVKVSNNDFSEFINYLIDLKQHDPQKIKAPLIRINESFFKEIGSELVKNDDISLSEQLLEQFSDKVMNRILKEDLDRQLFIEADKNNKGNYIIPDKTRYGLREEKMFPLNNMYDFKRTLNNFKNCPPLKRKVLAESLVSYCEEFSQKIPTSSLVWQYVPKKKNILKEDHLHDNCHHGNDRYELYDLKFNDIQSYPDINEILDNTNPNNIYMSSDYHLYQTKRKNTFTKGKIENINDIIIGNQSNIVKDTDVFIFMGDLVNDEFIAKDDLILKLSKLKGYKIFVLGNNDVFEEEFYYKCGFNKVVKGFKWKNFVFTHVPIKVENDYINIHGHIHGSRSYMGMNSNNHIDVYCDLYSYKPVTLIDSISLYNRGFYLGQDYAPDYYFDKNFIKKEDSSLVASINKARDLFNINGERKDEEKEGSFELFRLMGFQKSVTITNLKGSSDNNGGYYAVNYGTLPVSDNYEIPIYILGLLGNKVEEGSQVQVKIIGCVERVDGKEILIGKYLYNKREYNKSQISILIYPQERHQDFDLYLYDEKSKITQIVDIENSPMDIHSDDFMNRLIEGVTLDVEGNILLQTRQDSDFMARYMASHRLLKIYEQTRSYENIKVELCKLYYMIVIIETYYVKPKKRNPITTYLRNKNTSEALKSKSFIINDFTKYLKIILKNEPEFNFSEYFSRTEYYRDVIKITPELVRGLKKFIQSIVF